MSELIVGQDLPDVRECFGVPGRHMTDPRIEEIREAIENSLSQLKINLGPNSLEIANRGGSLHLSGSERRDATDQVLKVLDIDYLLQQNDAKDRRIRELEEELERLTHGIREAATGLYAIAVNQQGIGCTAENGERLRNVQHDLVRLHKKEFDPRQRWREYIYRFESELDKAGLLKPFRDQLSSKEGE